MKKLIFTTLTIFIFAHAFAQQKWNYPETQKIPVYDTIWGKVIQDDYRWMEDLKDPKVVDWFKTQHNFTHSVLEKIPNQSKLISELKSFKGKESVQFDFVALRGERFFYYKTDLGLGLKKLYYRDGNDGKEVLIFDPESLKQDKPIEFYADINADATIALLNISKGGTEIGDIYFLDIKTGKMFNDIVRHSMGAYFPIGSVNEVVYVQAKNYDVHDPELKLNMPLKMHKIGTPLAKDIILFSKDKYPEISAEPGAEPRIDFKQNSPFMVLGFWSSEKYWSYYYAPKNELYKPKINWKQLTHTSDKIIGEEVHGTDIYFLTSKNNPYFDIIKTSLNNPNIASAKVINRGTEEWKIRNGSLYGSNDYLIINLSRNELEIKPVLYHYKTDKTLTLNTGLKGSMYSFIPDNQQKLFIYNESWTFPSTFYVYNLQSKQFERNFMQPKMDNEKLKNLVSEEVEVPSWDGAMVPLTIVYDKEKLKKDGSNTVYLRGYGAFGINYTPAFNESLLPMLKRGVIVAYAHIRGGGEKGDEWHKAGMKENKPNSWKDFHACAEYLINHKYTSAQKIVANGSSGAGLFIGRAIQTRPDLYKAAIMDVAVLNAIRIESSPQGNLVIGEIGSIKNQEDFPAIYEMDAYHHIEKGGKYPAQLITTGMNDYRVQASMPGSFAAKMQDNNASDNPVLLYVNFDGGHFGALETEAKYIEDAQRIAFLLWQTGHPDFQPKK